MWAYSMLSGFYMPNLKPGTPVCFTVGVIIYTMPGIPSACKQYWYGCWVCRILREKEGYGENQSSFLPGCYQRLQEDSKQHGGHCQVPAQGSLCPTLPLCIHTSYLPNHGDSQKYPVCVGAGREWGPPGTTGHMATFQNQSHVVCSGRSWEVLVTAIR